jgi:Arc/MetJ family transcription regulator
MSGIDRCVDDAIFDVPPDGNAMRTTIVIDELLAKAEAVTGLKEKTALIREALKALIERETARRLVPLGGYECKLRPIRRRRRAAR